MMQMDAAFTYINYDFITMPQIRDQITYMYYNVAAQNVVAIKKIFSITELIKYNDCFKIKGRRCYWFTYVGKPNRGRFGYRRVIK